MAKSVHCWRASCSRCSASSRRFCCSSCRPRAPSAWLPPPCRRHGWATRPAPPAAAAGVSEARNPRRVPVFPFERRRLPSKEGASLQKRAPPFKRGRLPSKEGASLRKKAPPFERRRLPSKEGAFKTKARRRPGTRGACRRRASACSLQVPHPQRAPRRRPGWATGPAAPARE